jgi:dTDP-glucose pyrophosphorylase
VVSGDDLYDANDMMRLIKNDGYTTLCKAVERPSDFGIFTRDVTGTVTGLIEKPTDTSLGNLANIGNHKFDDQIFTLLKTIPLSSRGELEITDLIHRYISD